MGYEIQNGNTTRNLLFLLVQTADHISPLTGATPTVTLSKNGAAFAAPAGAVTEVGNGWYSVAANATDANTNGPLLLHATAASGDPTDEIFEVVAYNPDDATRLGLSSLPSVAPGASGGVFIAGTNAATTINGTAAVGATPAKAALTLNGGAASTTAAGVSAPGISATGGAGAASTNGAAPGVLFSGGGTTAVAGASGMALQGTAAASGLTATGGPTGVGVIFSGGSTSGDAFQCTAGGGGNAILLTATGTNHALNLESTQGDGVYMNVGSAGISITSGADGIDVFAGGIGALVQAAGGNGMQIHSTGNNGSGLMLIRNGTGHDMYLAGDGILEGSLSGTVGGGGGGSAPTAAQIASAVWQDTVSGDFTVANSIGKSLYTSGDAPGATGGLAIVGSTMTVGNVTVGGYASGEDPATSVWNAARTSFNETGSFGQGVASVQGNLTGSAGSVTGSVGSISGVTFPASFSTLNVAAMNTLSGHDPGGTLASTSQQTAILNAVNSITTNTSRTAITVPDFEPLPASGTSAVLIKITLYNLQGTVEDADSQSVTIHASNSGGTSLDTNLASTTATRDSTGQYHANYTLHSTDAEGGVYVAVTYTVGGVAMAASAVFSVAQADTLTTIAAIQTTVNTINTTLGIAGVGLTNLGDARLANLNATVSSRMATFALPTNFATLAIDTNGDVTFNNSGVATAVDVTSVGNAVAALGSPMQSGAAVVLAASQPDYAPARAGQQMDLVNAPNAAAVTAIQNGLATAANQTTLVNLAQADWKIDTGTTPWDLVAYQSGTNTELLRKKLKDVAGVGIADANTVLGQAVQ